MNAIPADVWLPVRTLLPILYRLLRAVPLPVVAAFTASTMVDAVWAAPQVSFDLSPVLACRDVTPDDFRSANPDERLVEFTVPVSSLLRGGRESDLIEFFYRFDSPNRVIRIVDYSPQTTLEGKTAGNVSIEDKNEKNRQIGLAVTAPTDWPVKVTGSGDLGVKGNHTVRYELAPKMTPVAASGTILRGHGVYFKLKPSRATSLEGAKDFTLTLCVPAAWRAGYLRLACTATGIERGVVRPLDETQVCGSRQFNLALFLEGDGTAKAAAERMTRAEQELLASIWSNRREIERRFYPTIAHKVGALLDVVKPPVPANWTEQLVFASGDAQIRAISQRMPRPVQRAVTDYTVARRELSQLGADAIVELQ